MATGQARSRTASCSCGELRVECRGEPERVSLCHCLDCQRRTGSAFGIAAFFAAAQVRATGDANRFSRESEAGYRFDFYFCPRCGATVYWETDRKPGRVIVAAGAFADPDFNAPVQSVYDEHRHPWLTLALRD